MSSLKDLFISIKVKPTGTEKLKEFNETIKTTLSLMKDFKRVQANTSINNAEKKLVETENKQKTNKKGSFLSIAPNIASVVYLTKALANLINKVGQLSYELLKLNRNFGVSTNMLQNFGYEAVANGVKMEDFNSAIATLKKNSADIMLGRGNISPYALLGLNPHEDPEKMLVNLQRRLRELPESIGTAFASDLGLSMDMINYIRKADFSRAGSRAILSNKELRILERARNIILDFKNTITVLIQKVGTNLAPIFNTVFGGLNYLIQSLISNTRLLGDVFTLVFGTLLTKLVLKNPILSAIMGIFIVVEDLVKTGGKGLSVWFEFISLKIQLLFEDIKSGIANLMSNSFVGKFFDKIIPSQKSVDTFINKPASFLEKNVFSHFRDWLGVYPEKYLENYVDSIDVIKARLRGEEYPRDFNFNLSGKTVIEYPDGKKAGEITGDNLTGSISTSLAGQEAQ